VNAATSYAKNASTRYERGVIMLVDPNGSRWDIYSQAGLLLMLRRGMGIAGLSTCSVRLHGDGHRIDWSTQSRPVGK
jgi:hypothetical protein